MTWVGVAIAGGAVVGAVVEGNAAKGAANTQAGAAENAQQISENEFNTITGQEQPFMQAGYGATNQLDYLLGIGGPERYGKMPSTAGAFGSLTQPFNMNDWRQLSPAYGFQRQQGMQGTLNMDASGAGALSGAAQKDLMSFNQNLANTSFNNAFNMYQTQQGNIYDRLAGIMQTGQSAATNTGNQGTALAGQAAQSAQNIGTALAGGQVGAANAYSNALTSSSFIPWLMNNQSPPPETPTYSGAPSGPPQ